jgi:segregation and condensation protein B
MTDERPESLAAQAASWVPPWERAPRPPDQDYAVSQRASAAEDDDEATPADDGDDADLAFEGANPAEGGTRAPVEVTPVDDGDGSEPAFEGANPAEGGTRAPAEATPTGDGDDADPGFEGPNPAEGGTRLPDELAPLPGEAEGSPRVDAPQELPGEPEPEPTEFGGGPELPMPESIAQAVVPAVGLSPLVDAPMADGGENAVDVFDAAAYDDVTDDAEVDMPFTEVVPGPEEDDASASDYPAGRGFDGVESPVGEGAAGLSAAALLAAAEAAEAGEEPVSQARPSSEIPAQGRRRKGDAAASVGPSSRTGEGLDESAPEPMEDGELRAALEAILLVVDEPVAEMQLAQITEQSAERIGAMLEDISARYTAAGHGFDLRRAAGGWRLYTRPEYAPYVERFVLDGQSVRLTQAALETLAVVAYKQPVTRSRISAIRGVNCDGVMRTLNTRGLIEECGTEGETGAFLYRTTALFLEKLGLNSVDQLPPLAPFLPDDVEEVLDASG